MGIPCGAEEDRTPDLLNAIQALSQLSYGPFSDFKIYTTMNIMSNYWWRRIRPRIIRHGDSAEANAD